MSPVSASSTWAMPVSVTCSSDMHVTLRCAFGKSCRARCLACGSSLFRYPWASGQPRLMTDCVLLMKRPPLGGVFLSQLELYGSAESWN